MAFNLNEHIEMFDTLLSGINCEEKYSVLDAGSGMTSLNIITERFKNSNVDAICFPGDYRKIDSIKMNIIQKNYTLIERDICKYADWKKYDFVFAHLLLGESTKFDNEFSSVLKSLISINGSYLMIIDYPEDPCVKFEQIFDNCYNAGYELISEHIVNKNEPQYDSKGQIIGHYYRGILFNLKSIL